MTSNEGPGSDRDAAREIIKEYVPDMNSVNLLADDSLTMERLLENNWKTPEGEDIDPKAFLEARLEALNEVRKSATQTTEEHMVTHSDKFEKDR